MSDNKDIDYGPLNELIGVWHGDKGLDVAPEPEAAENNPYYETITFSAIGDVTNAELQVLAAIHYRRIVQRKSNDKIFHDETGYWMWDANTGVIFIPPHLAEEVVDRSEVVRLRDFWGKLMIKEGKYTPGENLPPTAPDIDGPANGDPGTEYDYIFNAVDPDGDDVRYYITWGDGLTDWTDFGASGTDVIESHAWDSAGTYTITAYAEDSNGMAGPESTYVVTMPRGIISINTMFLRLLEKFPNAFPLIRHLLGL